MSCVAFGPVGRERGTHTGASAVVSSRGLALPATQSQTFVVKTTTTTASHQRLVGGYQKPEQEPEGMMVVHHRGSH
ncbi:unnamed protein product, partial [Sphagnum tenellum]